MDDHVRRLKEIAEAETDPVAKENAWLAYYDALDSEVAPPTTELGMKARVAYERGDLLFQFSRDLIVVEGRIVTMTNYGAPGAESPGAHHDLRQIDVNDVLNEVAVEGWGLLSMSTAFVPLGEATREKFLMTGQQTAITGTLVGTYLFGREELYDEDETG